MRAEYSVDDGEVGGMCDDDVVEDGKRVVWMVVTAVDVPRAKVSR